MCRYSTLQIFSIPLKTVPSQQGGGKLDDDQDKEVHVHVSREIFHVQTQSKVHKCVNKPRMKNNQGNESNSTSMVFSAKQKESSLPGCQFRYSYLQESVIEIKGTHQFKQQIMIRFLSFGVLIKSNVPYSRASSLLTSAFLTSVITCFRCLESTLTPFLTAYFMSRL